MLGLRLSILRLRGKDMIHQNLHMHTTFDDGAHSPQEMIEASIAAGLTSVGVSLHSPMPFENDWAPPLCVVGGYLEEMERMKRLFAGRIAVYAGIEWDVLSTGLALNAFDYVIGSAHHLPVGGRYPAVDDSAQTMRRVLDDDFGGDADAMAAAYFEQVARVARKPEVDIVGHFDLLTKFNAQHAFFDETGAAYRRAALEAMEELVRAGKIFEVNTGAISRGYRHTPYPARPLLIALREMGGRVTVSADAHDVRGVACAFDAAEQLVKACGFTQVWQLEGRTFVPVSV